MIVREFENFDIDEIPASVGLLDDINTLVYRGAVRSIIIEGHVAAIVGICPQWEDCAQAWAIVNDIDGHGIAVTKIVKDLINQAIEKFKIRQIRVILTEVDKNIKWAELLGFVYEGKFVRACSNGDDILIYLYERRN